MKFKMDREFYLPREAQGRTNIQEIKKLDSVVYTYETKDGKPGAMAFHGKAAKPDWHFGFRTVEQRAAKIDEFFANRQSWMDYQAKNKADRKSPHTLTKGAILYTSWGYDQTNIDFYEVTKVIGSSTVEIREIAGKSGPETGFMTAETTADPGNYIGEPMIKRANATNSVHIASYASASPWDGKPKRYSWYA